MDDMKLCKDCKHMRVNRTSHLECHLEAYVHYDPVTGTAELVDTHRCHFMRQPDNWACGIDGKKWEYGPNPDYEKLQRKKRSWIQRFIDYMQHSQ